MRMSVAFSAVVLALHMSAAPAARLKDAASITPGTRIAYGSFDVYMGTELYKKGGAVLYVLPADAQKAFNYVVPKKGDGVFYWALEPGNYLLLGFTIPFGGVLTNYIGAEFQVPESGGDIYIGSIQFRMTPFGGQLSVDNQFERVAAIYDGKFPERAGTSIERTLQDTRVGNYTSMHNPCDPEWGLPCEDKRLGVTPLTPLVKKLPGIWPLAESVTPTFSWERSETEGMRYDLIVYEAVWTSMAGLMKGRMTQYQEGLTEPRWKPEAPLKPNTHYYWSVRLRQGDRVTAWSTQGFFMFALFAWGSGSGQWFQFKTP
jgi:hypothetical protein